MSLTLKCHKCGATACFENSPPAAFTTSDPDHVAAYNAGWRIARSRPVVKYLCPIHAKRQLERMLRMAEAKRQVDE